MERRKFIQKTGLVVGGISILGIGCNSNKSGEQVGAKLTSEQTKSEDQQREEARPMNGLKISLAQWSLHKQFQSGELDHLDFAITAKNTYGIHAVEYVNQFFKDKAKNKSYLDQMNKMAISQEVEQLLIMVDGEGGLAELDEKVRTQSIENHYQWVEAAQYLGCHSIRVNAFGSEGNREEMHAAAVDGLRRLATFAEAYDINIIVENHGGLSSDGGWLSGVMKEINMDTCGTLPDFGNFCVKRDSGTEWGGKCIEEYDRYKGVTELMPYAKAVSAKFHEFNADGEETHTDYKKMMEIVKVSGYSGYVGIEYEGSKMSAHEGIIASKKLLEKYI